jgi:hypothetical protein
VNWIDWIELIQVPTFCDEGYERFEVFMTVKIHIEVFWVVAMCDVVVGYQCFRGLPS